MTSFLEELREEAQQARAQATKVLAIPGSRFAVRFRPPSRDKLDVFLAAYRANMVSADDELQFLIDCHDEILRRVDDQPLEQSEPVDPDGEPLRFDASDERWGDHIDRARECVAELYQLKEHPLAAAGHVEALLPWLQGFEAELARRVEGKPESNGGRSVTPPD